MDIVYIRDLRIETIIGIYDWVRLLESTMAISAKRGIRYAQGNNCQRYEQKDGNKQYRTRIRLHNTHCRIIRRRTTRTLRRSLHHWNSTWCTCWNLARYSRGRTASRIARRTRTRLRQGKTNHQFWDGSVILPRGISDAIGMMRCDSKGNQLGQCSKG